MAKKNAADRELDRAWSAVAETMAHESLAIGGPMTSPAIERVLSDIHALLGETQEAAAAIEELRTVWTILEIESRESAVEHALSRLLLALKKADTNTYARGYADAVSDYEEGGE